MSDHVRRESFHPDELVLVPEPANPVVLGSGGPIMDLVATEGDRGLCQWEADDGTTQRHMFPLACLYRCEKFSV